MGILIFIGIFILLLIFIVFLLNRKDKKKTKFMRHFSQLLKTKLDVYNIEGTFRNHFIKIQNTVKKGTDRIELFLNAPGAGGYGFSLISRNKNYKHKSSDFKTGDKKFDDLILITTKNKRKTLSLLSEEVRKKILHYIDCTYNFKITNENLFYSNDFAHQSKWIDKIVELEKFSDSISRKDSVDYLLIQNIENDSNPIVRQLNMEYLMKSKDLDKYKNVFEKLQNSADKKISVMASYALKDKEKLVDFLKSDKKEIVLFTLVFINKYSNAADFLESVYELLDSDEPDVLINVVKLFISSASKKPLNEVKKFLNRKEKIINKYDELKINTAKYFRFIKDKIGYNWLTDQLEKDNDPDEVTLEIFQSLKSIDNINAVEYIMPYTKGFHSDEIKKAAGDVISKLQKNLSSKNRGNLAVLETGLGGEVSIEDGENKGDLSLEE